jgi:hypothetical protein
VTVTEPPEAESQEPGSKETDGRSGPVAMAFGVLFLLGVGCVALLVLYRIYPEELPGKTDPGFIDNIFANNIVVFATRLVLFSAALVLAFVAAYIIWSIVNWVKLGQFLTRAGPFEVSQQAVSDLSQEAAFWLDAATKANTEVQVLRERLEESDRLIDEMYSRLTEQDEELERLRESEGGTP